MRELGLAGAVRGKVKRTTVPAATVDPRPDDLVQRVFRSSTPNRLWVADLTYVATWSGWVYVAFVMDVYSRRIVGWRCSTSLHTDLAVDTLEQGLWQRARDGHEVRGLIHHSDRGTQYLSVWYTDHLDAAGAVRSVGSRGDSYDNAAVESLIGLYKTELIRRRGPWKGLDDVEWPPWSTSTGSTTAASTAPAAISHRSSSRTSTTVRSPASPRTNRQHRASTEPGAVQTGGHGRRTPPAGTCPTSSAPASRRTAGPSRHGAAGSGH